MTGRLHDCEHDHPKRNDNSEAGNDGEPGSLMPLGLRLHRKLLVELGRGPLADVSDAMHTAVNTAPGQTRANMCVNSRGDIARHGVPRLCGSAICESEVMALNELSTRGGRPPLRHPLTMSFWLHRRLLLLRFRWHERTAQRKAKRKRQAR
jgi:hypothetical protein